MDTVPFVDLGPYVERVRGRSKLGVQCDPLAGETFATGHPVLVSRSILDDISDLIEARQFIGGPVVTAFEEKLAKRLGANHVVSCASGTDALVLALRAAGIDRGHRVALPNLTFWATYEAVVQIGATPVLLDTDPIGQLSFEEFEHAFVKHRFDAAIIVHLYGWCSAKLATFRQYARAHRITLIEDGAQAFGTTLDNDGPFPHVGESVFHDADVATLSFYPAKVLGGIGDGGAVVCRSERTAKRVRLLANHGRTKHYEHAVPGWNSRLDAIQAAWLTRALDVIDEVIERRCAIFERYYSTLWQDADAPTPLREGDDVYHNGYLMPIVVSDPTAVQVKLHERRIETQRVYPLTIADQQGAHGAIQIGELIESRKLASQVVCLPLWYGMTDAQVDRVCEALR